MTNGDFFSGLTIGGAIFFALTFWVLSVIVPLWILWHIIRSAVLTALRQHERQQHPAAPRDLRRAVPPKEEPRPAGYVGSKVLTMPERTEGSPVDWFAADAAARRKIVDGNRSQRKE